MAKPKSLCLDCDRIFNRKPNTEVQKCPDRGSTNTERLTRSGQRTSPPPSTPPTVSETGPSIPEPPGPPPVFSGPRGGGGGGAITPEMLLRAKANLKKVRIKLPGPDDSSIPRGIRILAYKVRSPWIMDVRWCVRSTMREYPGYFYTQPRMIDLSGELGLIARGVANPNHGNFNTEYRNLGRELPSGLFKTYQRRHPFKGSRIAYFEYGWQRTLTGTTSWYEVNRGGALVRVGQACQRALEGYWRARGNQINVERLILAETGEVVYTPDHYASFYRYSMSGRTWHRYESAEKLNGMGAEWDESYYKESA